MMIGDPQGKVLSWITPLSSNYYNYFFTSFDSRIDYLYNPIFCNGELGKNGVSCSSSLLGGSIFMLLEHCPVFLQQLLQLLVFSFVTSLKGFIYPYRFLPLLILSSENKYILVTRTDQNFGLVITY
jgi:hypothetical protein